MILQPYTAFGKTKMLPVVIWYNGKIDPTLTEWQETLWVERGEDWYGLSSPQLRGKKVRIIRREDWLQAK